MSLGISWFSILALCGLIAVACLGLAVLIAAVGSAKRKTKRDDE